MKARLTQPHGAGAGSGKQLHSISDKHKEGFTMNDLDKPSGIDLTVTALKAVARNEPSRASAAG
jgi:hypothetical protein